jgi:hypothetical protein
MRQHNSRHPETYPLKLSNLCGLLNFDSPYGGPVTYDDVVTVRK